MRDVIVWLDTLPRHTTRSPITLSIGTDMKSATADTSKRPSRPDTTDDLPLPVLPPPTIEGEKAPFPDDSSNYGYL
jgi:hypothetical protein